MTKLNILILFLVSSFSGCWLANDFSQDCVPATCGGTCEDNVCVSAKAKADTGPDVADVAPDSTTAECILNTDCATGEECAEGVCILTLCKLDTDCEGDEICNLDTGACDLPPECTVATQDQDCDSNETCNDGTCELKPCISHAECGLSQNAGEFTGNELCVAGKCEELLFKEGVGECTSFETGGVELTASPEDTIIIPVVTSVTGTDSAVQNQAGINNGYKLAVKLANTSGALSDGTQFIYVMCDDAGELDVSRALAEKLIDRTKTNTYLGQSQGSISAKVAAFTTTLDVFTWLNTSDIAYTTLDDNDLAFRNLPSEALSLKGIIALLERYDQGSVGLLYQTDLEIFDAQGLRLQALNGGGRQITVGKFQTGAYDDAVRKVALATTSIDPVDILIVIGSPADIPSVISEYRNKLTNKFDNKTPRIILAANGVFASPLILGIDPANIQPNKVEVVAGAVTATESFKALMLAEFNIEYTPISQSAFDSATTTMLLLGKAGKSATGIDLRDLLRARFSDDENATVLSAVADFGSALDVLRTDETTKLNLLAASGGRPIVFDDKGDTFFPIVSYSFRPAEGNTFILFRLFLPVLSLDLCLSPVIGALCEQGYTDSPTSPPQACVPSQPGIPSPYGTCLPVCSTAGMIGCPPNFLCTQVAVGSELCVPQI